MSPTMTVVVLAVLWLIVIVPMVVRRKDERSRERSVSRFGEAMKALAKSPIDTISRSLNRDSTTESVSYVLARRARGTAEVFVAGARRATSRGAAPQQMDYDEAESVQTDAAATERVARRRPVPAAEETLMHPVEREHMSPARAQMMARRRRSLTVLGIGTLISLVLGGVIGGVAWLITTFFVASLASYVWFLRSQAVRDRERRANRLYRAGERHRSGGYDLMEFEAERLVETPDSAVRIDDDHMSLHNMDTIDLTGLYNGDMFSEPALQRRAG